ncbi:general odorant-binding protein 57c [Photinus pyralis]|uniref:general odorant-binding protein 57c n=1 Tax=Photinus pyralis TaxID=7054 RepID=UPI001266ED05|nr:general odorant-binding protein 57c [Photinus pyralis]
MWLIHLLVVTNANGHEICDEVCKAQKRIELLSPVVTECVCSTGVDWALVNRWFNDLEFFNDSCFMCFVRCVQIKTNLIKPDGTLNIDKIVTLNPDVDRNALLDCSTSAERILDVCKKSYQLGICTLEVVFSHY